MRLIRPGGARSSSAASGRPRVGAGKGPDAANRHIVWHDASRRLPGTEGGDQVNARSRHHCCKRRGPYRQGDAGYRTREGDRRGRSAPTRATRGGIAGGDRSRRSSVRCLFGTVDYIRVQTEKELNCGSTRGIGLGTIRSRRRRNDHTRLVARDALFHREWTHKSYLGERELLQFAGPLRDGRVTHDGCKAGSERKAMPMWRLAGETCRRSR
jgi:hypothetical protein